MLVATLTLQAIGRSHLMPLLAEVEPDICSIQFAFQAFLEILMVSAHIYCFLSENETIITVSFQNC